MSPWYSRRVALSEVVCHRGRVVAMPSQKWYVTVVKSYDCPLRSSMSPWKNRRIALSEVVRHRGRVVGLPSQKWVCHRGRVVAMPSLKWYVTVVKS